MQRLSVSVHVGYVHTFIYVCNAPLYTHSVCILCMHKRKKCAFVRTGKSTFLLHNALYNNTQNILQITNFAFAIPFIMTQLLQCKRTKCTHFVITHKPGVCVYWNIIQGDQKVSVAPDFLYCNHQVHRGFLITL